MSGGFGLLWGEADNASPCRSWRGQMGFDTRVFLLHRVWHGYCRVHTIPIETNADLSNTPPLIDSSPSAGLHLSISPAVTFPTVSTYKCIKKGMHFKDTKGKTYMHLSADCFNTFFPIKKKINYNQLWFETGPCIILYYINLVQYHMYACMHVYVYIYKCVCVCARCAIYFLTFCPY